MNYFTVTLYPGYGKGGAYCVVDIRFVSSRSKVHLRTMPRDPEGQTGKWTMNYFDYDTPLPSPRQSGPRASRRVIVYGRAAYVPRQRAQALSGRQILATGNADVLSNWIAGRQTARYARVSFSNLDQVISVARKRRPIVVQTAHALLQPFEIPFSNRMFRHADRCLTRAARCNRIGLAACRAELQNTKRTNDAGPNQ